MVVAKSPLTGTWADSNSGGFFGPELKVAGYDGVFFSGISAKPVYLWISSGKAELRDASSLWGKDTTETEDALLQELGEPKAKVACIGPSGEACTLMAGIVTDKGRMAARSGLGAVMGSKRLKAVVVKGDKKVAVADAEALKGYRDTATKSFQESDFQKGLYALGPGGGTSFLISIGECGLKNWQLFGADAMPTCTNLDAANMEKYKVKRYACQGCPIACGAILELKEGPFAIKGEVHRPQYETSGSFGTMCLNDNSESIIKMNDICNRWGVDTISAGSTIAFAMECYERGAITEKDTDGIKLTWGNAEAMIAILEKMVRREGFGAVLADGVKKAAEQIGKGSQEYAVHVHGRELPMHDTRNWPARASGYLVDAEASNHCFSDAAMMLDMGVPLGFDPALQAPQVALHGDYAAKGPLHKMGFEFFEFISSAGMCSLTTVFNPGVPVAEFVAAVTGWDFTWAEGLNAGHRILTLRQAFNVREGLTPNEFQLPARTVLAASSGPNAGVKVDIDALKTHCFAALGWDLKTGKPYRRTMIDLGLDDLTKDLWE
jgi:aldehyde:ferredoxin oxidoreductase